MQLRFALILLAACEIGGPTPPPVPPPGADAGRLGVPPLPGDALPRFDAGIMDGGIIVHLDSLP